MLTPLPNFEVGGCLLFCVTVEKAVFKLGENILDGYIGRMFHIGGVETVVAEVVVHNFECGKVEHIIIENALNGQPQGGLVEEIPFKTVVEVMYGADCEYDGAYSL